MDHSAHDLAMTPMMQQYFRLKQEMPEGILFFRMGDFYEIFGEDALDVAPKLDIVLTSREKGGGSRIPFCGVPHHSAKNYWLKLLSLGYRVAIGDQVEEASQAKGLVKRAITRIYTPGCVDDLDALTEQRPNYLLGLYEDPATRRLDVVLADVSTGEMRAGCLSHLGELLALVQLFRPRELVCRRFFQGEVAAALEDFLRHEKLVFSFLPEGILRDQGEQERALRQNFGLATVEAGPLVAALLAYITGMHAGVGQFTQVLPLKDPTTMSLNEVTRRDLELFETVRRRSREGSLFHEMDFTLSPMGGRVLYQSLLTPFCQEQPIKERQQGVLLLRQSEELMREVRNLLKGTPDIERLTTRVLSAQASPLELAKVRLALEKARGLKALLMPLTQGGALVVDILANLASAEDLLSLLEPSLAEQPSDRGTSLGVFKTGYDSELDLLRDKAFGGEELIRQYEMRLKESTGISSLKIRRHKSYGLQIEVTKTNLAKVPEAFMRRQTMVNNERFVTHELIDFDESLEEAMGAALRREEELYLALLAQLSRHKEGLRRVSHGLGISDLLQSFAHKSLVSGWTCPRLSTTERLDLKASRHPVVESFVGRYDFVPNDVLLSKGASSLVITGPNMGGKSTVMRQTALAALLHQIGAFVPCDAAELPLYDNIFTRVGAADDLSQGQSTFMVEMSEIATILRQASPRSLIILDEVGRGTSTEDGMAIALAILSDLTSRIACHVMFATHFHEILPAVSQLSGVKLMQVEVLEGDTIQFTHRLKAGVADSSFGIEVAKLAGVPERVIQEAVKVLRAARPTIAREAPLVSGRHDEFIDKLLRMNLNRTTPLQALRYLYTIQEGLVKPGQTPLFDD